ncbi:low temperature requirement protein A [Acanthopleuribacter pedis]|uniref:Low temperature requirement protein A n=1 Tax=Acanthopleuribacter pedis TaxID=442870 RepID=A0A8J7Q2G5_9BACT|nr:low temperature requirement protein A [Acanthopleuribacter pedis]MBO1318060.1 low temperature requirement protein A [Acanthopleuribacter pedis]
MRSRWFHIPKFHTIQSNMEKRVGWLELFYDLIFVASFIQLGNTLSEYVSIERFFGFIALFTPIWIVWYGFTHFANRFDVDDFLHRSIVYCQMFAVGAMAVTVPQALRGEHQLFAYAYAGAQFCIFLMYLRCRFHQKEGRETTTHWALVWLAGTLLWLISAWLPTPYAYGAWVLGLLLVIGSPLRRSVRAFEMRYPVDLEHLSERYGLMTIIVLGESFVKMLGGLVANEPSLPALAHASFALIVTCALWWIYFDDIADSRLRRFPFAYPLWLFGHLPLHCGTIAVGVGLQKVIYFDLWAPGDPKYRWLLCGALALVFFATALVESVTERKNAVLSDQLRVYVRLLFGFLMVVLPAAAATMPSLWFLVLLAGACLIQVGFDMMTAPFDERNLLKHHGGEHPPAPAPKPGRTVGSGHSVSRGAPSNLRQDLFTYFMQASWIALFITIAVFFFLLNVLFAALYLMVPDTIANARPDSFADAFYFSVQTMSTIGYGTLTPTSDYGHIIATIEAGVSWICVALVTGLIFAKASRPRHAVLFSEPILLTRHNSQPVLMFRVGNARGNDIIDASLNLTVLIDEVTDEGNHLRAVKDLKLTRSSTPFFSMTWLVIHPVDEDSPLFGLGPDQIAARVSAFCAVIVGHDGTYSQSVYARHTYYPEDVKADHTFVDVLSSLDDGRVVVDYHRFHQTQPVKGSPPE